MQSFNTYGFSMNYTEGEHEKYADIKAAIENLCIESEKLSKLYEKNPLIHYVQIDEDLYITCCVKNFVAQFGMYDKNNKKIVQHVSATTSHVLSKVGIDNLLYRMESLAKNKRNPKIEQLYKAWNEFIKEQESEFER